MQFVAIITLAYTTCIHVLSFFDVPHEILCLIVPAFGVTLCLQFVALCSYFYFQHYLTPRSHANDFVEGIVAEYRDNLSFSMRYQSFWPAQGKVIVGLAIHYAIAIVVISALRQDGSSPLGFSVAVRCGTAFLIAMGLNGLIYFRWVYPTLNSAMRDLKRQSKSSEAAAA